MSEPNLPTRMIRKLTSWTHRFDDTGTKRDRALQLVGVVLGTGALFFLTDWLTNSGLFQQLFYPTRCDTAKPETCPAIAWKDLFQATVLLLGLPVAFMLWHWRDRNVRDEIENSRKDVSLKEFQDVQSRAVGAIGDAIPTDAKDILQVAALHQLRGFLRGDFGKGFKRPAFETYCALISLENAAEWKDVNDKSNLIPLIVFETLRLIIYEDWKFLFWEDFELRKGWPLSGRSFHSISLPPGTDLAGLNLSRTNFHRSELDAVNFERCQCWDANFSDCTLRGANFAGAEGEGIKFNGSDLAGAQSQGADFSGASLSGTKLHGGNFSQVSFASADGAQTKFMNTNLCASTFNGAKLVDPDFSNCDLKMAKFVGAQIVDGRIVGVILDGCDLSFALLGGFFADHASSAYKAILNTKTKLPHPQIPTDEPLLTAERQEVLSMWLAKGAIGDNAEAGTFKFKGELDDSSILTRRRERAELEQRVQQASNQALIDAFGSGKERIL